MQQIKWFDRKFEFTDTQNIMPSIIDRMEGAIIRLKHKLQNIEETETEQKPDGKWSIKEQVGHLIDLEPLWYGRMEQILEGKENLLAADLENRKTHEADHNQRALSDLIAEFENVRKETLLRLQDLTEEDVFKSALHPRLNKPMRMMDLFLFVAEHDDHHLVHINDLISDD